MPFIQHCLGGKRSLHEYYSGGCDVQVRILQRTSNPGSGSSLRPMTHEEVEASLYNTHLSAGSQAPSCNVCTFPGFAIPVDGFPGRCEPSTFTQLKRLAICHESGIICRGGSSATYEAALQEQQILYSSQVCAHDSCLRISRITMASLQDKCQADLTYKRPAVRWEC